MDLEYRLVASVDKRGNPADAYVMSVTPGGQLRWVADTDFGPFDTWLDLMGWYRRVLSVDLDSRFT